MKTIVVCTHFRPLTLQPSCAHRGSEALADWLEGEIKARGLDAKVDRSVCLGHCSLVPNVRLLGEDFCHESTQEKLLPLLEALNEPD